MSDWNVDFYRERERHWRGEAWRLPPGHDREACFTLADGYARLVEIIEGHDTDPIAPSFPPQPPPHRATTIADSSS